MVTILKPFRVAYMPDPTFTLEGNGGIQHVSAAEFGGYDTAEEALVRAAQMNENSLVEYRWWVVVEIQEVRKKTPEQVAFLAHQRDLEQARSDSSRLGDASQGCRFCFHELSSHNRLEGCMRCTCAATSGEARFR